jgi:4-hydroxythreonine-4-phosphate dehydrogenase
VSPLVVTPGDRLGIGPEVAAAGLAAEDVGPVVVVGSAEAFAPWAARAGLRTVPVDRVRAVPDAVAVLDPGDDGEPVEIASLRLAVEACRSGAAAGLVTGPIHKARMARRGFRHPGHTEFLGELCGVERPVMAFVGGRVRVALCTVHVPLRRVAEVLTTDLVAHTIRAVVAAHARAPRIAVCGPNPHAGDEGLLGDEDARVVAPAVVAARAAGVDARGPMSAEAAFRAAVRGEVDWVVAAYHDQGLAPLKALEWASVEPGAANRSVNWTLGLPILRMGVDHGTADDIAGKGVADAGGMRAALRLARATTVRRATGAVG